MLLLSTIACRLIGEGVPLVKTPRESSRSIKFRRVIQVPLLSQRALTLSPGQPATFGGSNSVWPIKVTNVGSPLPVPAILSARIAPTVYSVGDLRRLR